ncbi:MAG TPA: Lrp/AsnC family transcriptional regulator [bacterium]|nr:Lrp/AsnC family transcriptional regulator [bacterium]
METAFVLINAEIGKIPDVIEELKEIPEVTEVYSIAGEYDILVKLKFADIKSLGEIVPKRLHSIKGITRTLTLLTFKTHKYVDFDLSAGHKEK